MPEKKDCKAGEPAAPRADAAPLVYRSEEILRGRLEVWIEHGNETYRLRLTAAGKLYLTK